MGRPWYQSNAAITPGKRDKLAINIAVSLRILRSIGTLLDRKSPWASLGDLGKERLAPPMRRAQRFES